ncbi:MAG: rhamnulokinase [Bacteroidaceae bacterium]|nr:rhamnulokinase [Bacteroidaceae bacterium]
MNQAYLAADFGGGSGRVIAGWLDAGRLQLKEVHRFRNRQVRLGARLYWDFPALFEDLKEGLKRAAAEGFNVKSVGVDTWGVDFGLIDREGELIGLPVCYRDGRTQGMQGVVFQRIDRAAHYACTGIQQMDINTLFQLYSMKCADDFRLEKAHRLLFMPDLFAFFLTGVASNEYTIASTSELLDAARRNWSWPTLKSLGLPQHLFSELVEPGQVRGRLTPELAAETRLGPIDVVAVGSHDTASAVVATPLEPGAAFLSSGTWSLLGVELAEPILTEAARLAEFTNEGGVGGTIRFLQNITGLWLLQRLMGEWEAAGDAQTFDTLLPAAEASTYDALLPVADARFVNPASMEQEIAACLREQGVALPQTKADTARCVMRSLANKYAVAIATLSTLLPQPVTQLNIIGGGSQNALLNRFTAEAAGLPVLAGPVEATAMGNILVQAIAAGELADISATRDVVRRSIELKRYEF